MHNITEKQSALAAQQEKPAKDIPLARIPFKLNELLCFAQGENPCGTDLPKFFPQPCKSDTKRPKFGVPQERYTHIRVPPSPPATPSSPPKRFKPYDPIK